MKRMTALAVVLSLLLLGCATYQAGSEPAKPPEAPAGRSGY